jgi:hypothetical protein
MLKRSSRTDCLLLLLVRIKEVVEGLLQLSRNVIGLLLATDNLPSAFPGRRRLTIGTVVLFTFLVCDSI